MTKCNPTLHRNFTIQLDSSSITPSRSARNLGVVIDDQLNFTCRFALYNIRRIRPFLSEHATQLLVQALVLSRLDYCNALLAAAARVVFNEPKRTRHSSAHKIALVASCRSHQIQVTDVCLQNNHWLCSPLLKLITSDLCAIQELQAHDVLWCIISKRHKISCSDLHLDCSLLEE